MLTPANGFDVLLLCSQELPHQRRTSTARSASVSAAGLITCASGLIVSTVYQHFSNKDEIVWAVLSEVLAEATAHANQRIESAATGLAKITARLEFMTEELSSDAAKVRFMVQFDALYARDWPAERLLTLEAQINSEGFRYFSNLAELKYGQSIDRVFSERTRAILLGIGAIESLGTAEPSSRLKARKNRTRKRSV